MNLAASRFMATLDAEGLRYSVDDRQDNVIIGCDMQLNNLTTTVKIVIDNNNTEATLFCFGFVTVPNDKFFNALIACNELNNTYKWVKFYVDDDLDLNAQEDTVINVATCGRELFDLMFRMFSIVDEAFPEVMRELWKSN